MSDKDNGLFTRTKEIVLTNPDKGLKEAVDKVYHFVGPSRLWSKKVLHDIMTTCIIMHNMIIEDERDIDATIKERVEVPSAEVEMTSDDDARFQEFLARHRQIKIKDREAHIELRNALIEHLWSEYINSEN
ncbi:PREDICTED: uncharacterized protein LOC109125369 [Camelina sativa]|uniref:Uncharacterized protein LOC109125369 n=1 Tax=Camelina sativa TaxID=90675 RepID=A0ABM1Q6V7_CAMSA|nr:PREDICTED: uncharacterized protein LOC109125369 [Camelina sativa]